MTSARCKGALALAAVWLTAAIVIIAARAARPSAASLIALLQDNGLRDNSPAQHDKIVLELAGGLNQLTFEERNLVRRSEPYLRTFRTLSSAEKEKLLGLTFPSYSKLMLESIYRMPRAERGPLVDDLAMEASRLLKLSDDPAAKQRIRQIISNELRARESSARPEVRNEMKPVFDRLQAYLRSM